MINVKFYKLLLPLLSLLGAVIPGAGAFEIVAHNALLKYKDEVKGRAKLGILI